LIPFWKILAAPEIPWGIYSPGSYVIGKAIFKFSFSYHLEKRY
jgi:hypothetical protein